MDERLLGINDLLAFVAMHPIETVEVHVGNGSMASIDLVCSDSARLVGVSFEYLSELEDRDLLPEEVLVRLRALRSAMPTSDRSARM